MTNEEAAAMLESMKDYFLPTSPMLEERREEITAIDLAISALSKQSASSEQANDTDRTTDDQCGDGARMINLKKRTITERLIIANSLIASAIADSDNNKFSEDTKKTDDVPDTNVGDTISRQAAIEALSHMMDTDGFRDGWAVSRANVDCMLRSLPSAQSEQTYCYYCHENSDGYVKPIEKNCHAFIRFGMNGWELSLKANGWYGSAKIKYCPMCGRTLKNDK